MKNIFTKSRAINSNFIIAFSFAMLFISSCKKTEDTTASMAYLTIVNASPTLGTYNVYVNNSVVNNSGALPFGGSVKYMQLAAGSYAVKFTTASSIDNLLTKNISLAENTAYSFYLLEKAPNLDGLLIQDNLSDVSTEKGFIRFINLSPNAPALDLYVTDATTSTISDKTYKTASGFIAVDPKTYSFDIKNKATGLSVGKLEGAVVAAGVHYTIIARGIIGGTEPDRNFSAQIIANQ